VNKSDARQTLISAFCALACPRTTMVKRLRNLRPSRPIRTIGLTLLLATVLSGCNYRFGIPEPVTEQGGEVLLLWQVSLYAATGLGILVLGLLAYTMIRHRRRNNDLPKQTEGNVALEITYTIIPLIMVAALFVFGVIIQENQIRLTSDDDPEAAEIVNIDVTGYQWNWRFTYPEEDVMIDSNNVDLPEMVLPVNQTARFNLVAADVNHSFFVPGFLTKRDLIPGVKNEIEVTPNKTGSYTGHCAEYCGFNHSDMNFKVRVVPEAEYEQWLTSQKGAQAPA
jgi:cytochrome c oxidase subunit II